jgi:hypothetical protein
LKIMSSGVNGLPSCQVTPFFSFTVTERPWRGDPAVVDGRDLDGQDGDQVPIRIGRNQRLVEESGAVGILGADGEVGIGRMVGACHQRTFSSPPPPARPA